MRKKTNSMTKNIINNIINRNYKFLLVGISLILICMSFVSANPSTIYGPGGIAIAQVSEDGTLIYAGDGTEFLVLNDSNGNIIYKEVVDDSGNVIKKEGKLPESVPDAQDKDTGLINQVYDPMAGVWLGYHWPTFGKEFGWGLLNIVTVGGANKISNMENRNFWNVAGVVVTRPTNLITLGMQDSFYDTTNAVLDEWEAGNTDISLGKNLALNFPVVRGVRATINANNWYDRIGAGAGTVADAATVGIIAYGGVQSYRANPTSFRLVSEIKGASPTAALLAIPKSPPKTFNYPVKSFRLLTSKNPAARQAMFNRYLKIAKEYGDAGARWEVQYYNYADPAIGDIYFSDVLPMQHTALIRIWSNAWDVPVGPLGVFGHEIAEPIAYTDFPTFYHVAAWPFEVDVASAIAADKFKWLPKSLRNKMYYDASSRIPQKFEPE